MPPWLTASSTTTATTSKVMRSSSSSTPSGLLTMVPSSQRTRSSWPSDRKSTRLNSSHVASPYAVFCLEKQKQRSPANKQQAERTNAVAEKKKQLNEQ